MMRLSIWLRSRPATRTTPTTGTLIEPSSADALDAEIGALALDGREDIAAVALEDAHLRSESPGATVRRCAGDSELVVVAGLSGVGGWR